MKQNTDNTSKTLTLRAIAMPANTNANGDIFGGWLLSQMDLAGALCAKTFTRTRVATVGIESMSFHLPVLIGDEVSCYTRIKKIGRTSITVHIETWITRIIPSEEHKVTEGTFTYVSISEDRAPTPIVLTNEDKNHDL